MSDQEKQREEQLLRQFKRLDSFLHDNTLRFEEEFDTHNKALKKARDDIREQEDEQENKLVSRELRHLNSIRNSTEAMKSAREIDAEDGITNRIHMMTIVLARMSNPKLFQLLIQKRLNITDLEHLTFVQMPHEVDAILFITNPLLIFELLVDLMKFREKHKGFIFMYLSNRIARWLFCFTRFLIDYDELERMVRLTFLHEKRFTPFKQQFLKVVQQLCEDTRKQVESRQKPLFHNDLRRLYMLLTHALFIACREGIAVQTEIKSALTELVPRLNFDNKALTDDGEYHEFSIHHLGIPTLKDSFLEQFERLKQQDMVYTLEFLGYLHPADRQLILSFQYRQSRSYILRLLARLKQEYQQHQGTPPVHYHQITETLHQLINYQELLSDPEVDQSLVKVMFPEGQLAMGGTIPLGSNLNIPQSPLPEFIPSKEIFDAFYFDPADALRNDFLVELAAIPFKYVLSQRDIPGFYLLTLGEFFLMESEPEAFEAVLDYMLYSGQMTSMEILVAKDCAANLRRMADKLLKQIGTVRPEVAFFNGLNQLQWTNACLAVSRLRTPLEKKFPRILNRVQHQTMLMTFLLEIEKWLADRKKIKPHQLKATEIPHVLTSYQAKTIYQHLERIPACAPWKPQLDYYLSHEKHFVHEILTVHKQHVQLLAYDKIRFRSREPMDDNFNENGDL
ncbi:MAG: hypothetical protein HQM11_17830 [SAR324 cluster bacterium]|nr:hypothetical protein [SAR324 cluster bacterium]